MANPQRNVRLLFGPSTQSTTNVASLSHSWEDVGRALRISDGIRYTRGRANENASATPGVCSFTLDNPNDDFTPDNTTSQYYQTAAYGSWNLRRAVRVIHSTNDNDYRVNLAANPSFEVDTTGWIASGAGAAIARVTSDAYVGTASLEVTKAAAIDQGAIFATTSQPVALLSQMMTASARVRVPVGQEAGTFTINLRYYDAATGGNYLGGAGTVGTAVASGDGWVELRTRGSSTSYRTVSMAVEVLQTNAGTAGKKFLIDAVLLEPAMIYKPYFDGSYSGRAWLGTANASASITPSTTLWTGYVEDIQEGFVNGTRKVVRVKASDAIARMQNRTMRSVYAEEALYAKARLLYPLNEAAGATTVANVTSEITRAPADIVQAGSGGSITFGTASLLPWEPSETCAVFSRVDASNGKRIRYRSSDNPLSSQYLPGATATYVGLEAYVYLPVAVAGTCRVVELASSPWGHRIAIDLVANVPTAVCVRNGVTIVNAAHPSGAINTGQWAHLYLEAAWDTGNGTFIVNGSTTSAGGAGAFLASQMNFDRLTIGDTYDGGSVFNGWLSHVATYGGVTAKEVLYSGSTGGVALHSLLLSEGLGATFANSVNESNQSRLSRILRFFAKGTGSHDSANTGTFVVQQSPVSFKGQTALALAQTTSDAEMSPLYATPSGQVRMVARQKRMTDVSPVSYPASLVNNVAAISLSSFGVVNDVTLTRQNGNVVADSDAASSDQYGPQTISKRIPLSTDAQVQSVADYLIGTRKEPQARADQISLDLTTADATVPFTTSIALDIGTLLRITGLPRTLKTTLDFFIEGIDDTITETSWTRTLTTSPVKFGGQGWVLNDATYGVLGTTTLLHT